MPLIILGLVVTVGIVIYGLIMYARGDEDPRPVRERYAHAFPPERKGADRAVTDDEEEQSEGSESERHVMYFPTDAEAEKKKRNIH